MALDLTEERADPDRASPAVRHAASQDEVRRWLAYGLLALLAVVIVGGAILIVTASGEEAARVDRLLQTVFAGVLGLAGTATGFYFGAHDK